MKSLSRIRLFATPWTIAHQAPRSMGFSRQEYWSGLPFPSPGDLPDLGIEPRSPALEADALTSEPQGISKYSPSIVQAIFIFFSHHVDNRSLNRVKAYAHVYLYSVVGTGKGFITVTLYRFEVTCLT